MKKKNCKTKAHRAAGSPSKRGHCSFFKGALTACASWTIALSVLALLLAVAPAHGDTPVTLYQSFAGNINITGTGGTLRTNPDGINSCSVTNSGSMQLLGLPAGSTVMTAYLYWAGSGGDPQGGAPADYTVTFNGTAVTADRTFTAWYNAGGGNVLYFFGGVKDVTSQVTGNGAYTFADLTVQNANVGGGGQYCGSAAVLSAFSLLVIYSDPAETLHVVNVWEGFQGYRGASFTLTPSNFIVPTPAPGTPLSSRILVLTWEGDSGNSAPFGGFNENLTFCSPTPCAGIPLTDASNPLNNQFNSTVDMPPNGPFSGIDTTWGLDIDMYDITGMVPAGATSAQSVYSSGGDLVILANQTMAIPNEPVADLAITKGHAGNFTVGVNGTYTLNVSNNGPNDATGTITVTDTLPAGLTYVSATGTGWACGAVGQIVTCTRAGPLANGASAPSITLTVSVGAAAYPSVTNTATVSSGTFDNVAANSTNVGDPTTVLAPDLSTSTKTVLDLSGGDADPGDVLRYTVTVRESAGVAASGVSVTDTVPATLTNLMTVTCPPGASCNVAGQTLTVSALSVPASGAATIVFDAAIAGGTPVGTTIDNTATITPLAGTGAAAAAPTVIVSQSAIPQSGNKPLYLYGAPGLQLSRTPTPGAPAYVNLLEGQAVSWTLTPALLADSTLDPAVNPNVPVNLYLASNNPGGQNRNINVSLVCSPAGTTIFANRIINLSTAVVPQTFNLPLGAVLNCSAPGNNWVLTITNNTVGGGSRELRVYPVNGGNISQAVLPTTTVINVDSTAVYDAAYPVGSAIVTTPTGATVYLRSVISDPFGSYDITGATIRITDSLGAVRVNGAAMTQVADSGAATKTYEYTYAVPAGGPAGNWTIRVVGAEGTEGTISDFAQTALNVFIPMPNILMLKSVVVQSDPVNGAVNPKAIPGAAMLYTVTATNQGPGATDADTVVVTDPIPANTELFVGDLGGAGSGPVLFSDGATPSGLSYSFINLGSGADSIAFSNDSGATWTYTPVPDGNGYDANVTNIRVSPSGTFNGAVGPNQPSFNLLFQVRVK
jgi:uncharacterized repeat protein (TIGR01451 family)